MNDSFKIALAVLPFLALLITREVPAQIPGYTGHPEFAVQDIDPSLLLDSQVVVRVNEIEFQVQSVGRAVERRRRVLTVLGANGREAGRLAVPHDSFRRLRKIEGSILDAEGKQIRKSQRSDTEEFSGVSDFSLYDDSRRTEISLMHDRYPYTVVIEYEIEHRGYISWPTWYPLDSDASVEWSQFRIIVPYGRTFRIEADESLGEPLIIDEGARISHIWTASSITYTKPEPMGPPIWQQYPSVAVAPDEFEIGGVRGKLTSWQEFGKWYGELARGRDRLPESTRADVARIREESHSEHDLVRRLYQYMQERTRYVSVQLGIGGWQPFDAAYVVSRGYGDCKALTNFLFSLLQEAEVKSYPALIRAERYRDRVTPDFPVNRFNHVILMVELSESQDTLWLEATDTSAPFGYIGAANEDRWALVVDQDGGQLIRTPRSNAADNLQHRTGRLTLTEDGQVRASVVTTFTGDQQARIRPLASATAKDQDQWINRALNIGDYHVIESNFNEIAARTESSTLSIELLIPRFASPAGSRLIFQPNVMERSTYVPPRLEERGQEVILSSYPYHDIDSLVYVVPEGFFVEAVPEGVLLEEGFARFETSYEVMEDGTLVFRRELRLSETTLPANLYDAYRAFSDQVVRADAARVVISLRS